MNLNRQKYRRAILLETVLFLGGILVLMLAISLFCQLAGSLIWRLKLKYRYTEAQTRVEKTEVVRMEGSYQVVVTHRLETPGEHHETSAFTEEQDITAPTPAVAEEFRAHYQVGQLYPAWYLPGEPDYNNVLLRDGLELSWPLRRAWFPLVLGVPAWLACRFSWRRWKARGWMKKESGA